MASILESAKKLWRGLPFVGGARALVNVIELNGIIGDVAPGRRGLSHAKIAHAIEAAFKPGRLAAVALSINSPGGSPVQSRLILSAIRRAAAKKKTPVLAFIEDLGASGGYILALAGDEIYADQSSIIGSIGVIAATFGFQEAIARLGVERRIHTAGEAKSQLDPFKREDPQDVERLKSILEDMHRQFIDLVKERRGDKLSADGDIFSGSFWTAGPAKARGLIDGTAHLADFMKARYGEDVRLKRFSPDRTSLVRRLFGGEARARRGGGTNMEDALGALEERAMWARFGV